MPSPPLAPVAGAAFRQPVIVNKCCDAQQWEQWGMSGVVQRARGRTGMPRSAADDPPGISQFTHLPALCLQLSPQAEGLAQQGHIRGMLEISRANDAAQPVAAALVVRRCSLRLQPQHRRAPPGQVVEGGGAVGAAGADYDGIEDGLLQGSESRAGGRRAAKDIRLRRRHVCSCAEHHRVVSCRQSQPTSPHTCAARRAAIAETLPKLGLALAGASSSWGECSGVAQRQQ